MVVRAATMRKGPTLSLSSGTFLAPHALQSSTAASVNHLVYFKAGGGTIRSMSRKRKTRNTGYNSQGSVDSRLVTTNRRFPDAASVFLHLVGIQCRGSEHELH